jgi:glycosyltransferase involved in cell wall biosynthesis
MWLPLLVARGHRVRVIVGSAFSSSEDSTPRDIDGVSVEQLDRRLYESMLAKFTHYSALPGLRRHLAAAWALWHQADQGHGYDAVETTDWGMLFMPWIVEQHTPTLVQMHGSCGQIDIHDPVAGEEMQGHLIRTLEKLGIARASVVQTYSQTNADFWSAQTNRDAVFTPVAFHALAAPNGMSPRSSRGLVVGRIQRWKGPHVLCEALRRLGPQAPTIDWIGRDTTFGSRSQTTAGMLATTYPEIWNDKIVSGAPQPASVTARLQAEASFVVVPSTWDVFNFTCVEAMAVGTPVICSSGAGAVQWIEDGVNGFRFENEDAASLANALSKLIALGPVERTTLGQRGRLTVAEAMNSEKITDQRVAMLELCKATTQPALSPSDWLRLATAPRNERSVDLGFLEHLPLKQLSRHLIERTFRKLRRT